MRAQRRTHPLIDAGSYLRLIDSRITQLQAQGPSRTCNESKEEEEDTHLSVTSDFGNLSTVDSHPRPKSRISPGNLGEKGTGGCQVNTCPDAKIFAFLPVDLEPGLETGV